MSTEQRLTAVDVIELLGLIPLPGEGGFFRQTYLTEWSLDPQTIPGDLPGARPGATAIYFLVTPDDFSALHRLRGDELWHFYLGDPVELAIFDPEGTTSTIRLGHDLANGEQPQALAPAGTWLGCDLIRGGEWALLGTTMTPGFHPDDFELGDRDRLIDAFPAATDLIRRLTRSTDR